MRQRGEAERVEPDQAATDPRHHVRRARGPQLPVQVDVPLGHQLDPGDVQEQRQDADHEYGSDPCRLRQDHPPVGAADRVEGPRLPQITAGERSDQPAAVPRSLHALPRDERHHVEQRDGTERQSRNHRWVRPLPRHPQDRDGEGQPGQPLRPLTGDLVQGVECHRNVGQHAERAPCQEPSGAGQEPPDHRVWDVPHQLAESERPQHEEEDPGRDRGHGDRQHDRQERFVPRQVRGDPRHRQGEDRGRGVLNRPNRERQAREHRDPQHHHGPAEERETDPRRPMDRQAAGEHQRGQRGGQDDLEHAGHAAGGEGRSQAGQQPRGTRSGRVQWLAGHPSTREGWMPSATMGYVEAAFFDLDKTVISKSSSLALSRPFYRAGLVTRSQLFRGAYAQLVYLALGADEKRMERAKDVMLAMTKGWRQTEVEDVVRQALETVIDPYLYQEALDLIALHRALSRRVFIVSSAPEEVVRPLAQRIGVEDVIATRAEIRDGRYTGRLEFYCYREQKAEAIRRRAEEEGIDLERSYAYSDSITDRPMLELVGNPVVVNPDRELRRHSPAAVAVGAVLTAAVLAWLWLRGRGSRSQPA